ncbi:MAG TPA: cation:proton antiporter [Anaeromyxobacteraceae bacterium]|jgi:CPA2 family monovalent cation:H+ antiporter-2|nr:cation:proton antiporter [Anaeromyxobacteraceae bacterium]
MHDPHEFLKALTLVLAVAAVTTVIFHRLRQPVILGYLLAGLVVGPHVPVPLVANRAVVEGLSELGIILLMYALGLEFSLRKLLKVGPVAALTAAIETSLMLWLGFLAGRAFGWSARESVFAGALVAISSTTIIAKTFGELRVTGHLRNVVVGVLVVEDLVAILLLALLTAVASGRGLSAGQVAFAAGRLAAFLAGLLVLGLLLVPRAMRTVNRLGQPEITLVASLGICFGVSLLAAWFGYSVALGAFIAGSLVSEAGEERQVEPLVQPVKDLFGAIFFVSVGLLIDPVLVAANWKAVLALTLVVLLGKVLAVSVGAFLTGNGSRTSVQAGLSMAQIGEFSFIIAGLGAASGATRPFLFPVAVAVSALTTLSTPWLVRASPGLAALLDRKLPRPLQTFAALYGSWVEQLGGAPQRPSVAARVRRMVRLLLLDAALLGAIVIGTAVEQHRAVELLRARAGLEPGLARVAVLAAAAALSAPFCLGLLRTARRLGVVLGAAALPHGAGLDLAAAPRRALVVALQLGALAMVGVPLLALTQPFLPGVPGAAVLALLLAVLGVGFWRSATNLQGHVQAGAQLIVEALAKQARTGTDAEGHALDEMRRMLPGLGEPEPYRLPAASRAVGRSLAELDLRGLTGATVLAIAREEQGVLVPSAAEVLRAGDLLALAGTHEAIAAAREVLAAARG